MRRLAARTNQAKGVDRAPVPGPGSRGGQQGLLYHIFSVGEVAIPPGDDTKGRGPAGAGGPRARRVQKLTRDQC